MPQSIFLSRSGHPLIPHTHTDSLGIHNTHSIQKCSTAGILCREITGKAIPSAAGVEDQGEIGGPQTALSLSSELGWAARPHSLPVEAVLADLLLCASQLPAADAPTLSKDGFGPNQEDNLQGVERTYKECHP